MSSRIAHGGDGSNGAGIGDFSRRGFGGRVGAVRRGVQVRRQRLPVVRSQDGRAAALPVHVLGTHHWGFAFYGVGNVGFRNIGTSGQDKGARQQAGRQNPRDACGHDAAAVRRHALSPSGRFGEASPGAVPSAEDSGLSLRLGRRPFCKTAASFSAAFSVSSAFPR